MAAEVWRRHPPGPSARPPRLLRSPGLARALLTTPSLLLPWLISTTAVLAVGALINLRRGQPLVWLLAPGYRRGRHRLRLRPRRRPGLGAVVQLCSVSERMVLLVRAVCVFAVNAFLGLVVSAITYAATSPGARPVNTATVAITVAWLLPMTAVCALTLAVAVTVRSAAVWARPPGSPGLAGHGAGQQARRAATSPPPSPIAPPTCRTWPSRPAGTVVRRLRHPSATRDLSEASSLTT